MIYKIWACKRVEGSDRGLRRGTIQACLKENHEKCKDTGLNIYVPCTMFHTIRLPTNCLALHCVSSLTYHQFLLLRVSLVIGLKLPEDGVNSWIEAP